MPDYQKMYALLCGAASDAIDLIAEGRAEQASRLLQAALLDAEELYMAAGENKDLTLPR